MPAHTGDSQRQAMMAITRKKAVAWAVWALGNDQSAGIGTRSPVASGRGRRKNNLAAWTAITVTERLSPSSRTSRHFPVLMRARERMSDEGRRKYREPNQVMAVKNDSHDIVLAMAEVSGYADALPSVFGNVKNKIPPGGTVGDITIINVITEC